MPHFPGMPAQIKQTQPRGTTLINLAVAAFIIAALYIRREIFVLVCICYVGRPSSAKIQCAVAGKEYPYGRIILALLTTETGIPSGGAHLDVAEGSFSIVLKAIGEAVSTAYGTLDLHHQIWLGSLGSDKLTMPAGLDEPFPVETVRSKWKRAKNLKTSGQISRVGKAACRPPELRADNRSGGRTGS